MLFDGEVPVAPEVTARIVVRRAAEPLSAGFSRDPPWRADDPLRPRRARDDAGELRGPGRRPAPVRRSDLRGARATARNALNAPRPELVVKVDRSGLNEHHQIVKRLYAAIDKVLKPIVAEEERRAGANLIGPARAVTARDQVGLRALNDALKAAFDQPGKSGLEHGDTPAGHPPADDPERPDSDVSEPVPGSRPASSPRGPARLRFKQSPIRLHPGEARTITLLADPALIDPGTPVEIETDPGLTVTLRTDTIPEPGARGYSAVAANIRAKVTVEPGSTLSVLAAAGEHTCELEVIIVRHRASGWVREIARKDEDQQTEAEFDPETGIVTVYEGRREFRELERAARRAGFTKKRVAEYVPFRMLEVEAAANAVYAWAADQILARRMPEERPQTQPSTPAPSATKRKRYATAPTTS